MGCAQSRFRGEEGYSLVRRATIDSDQDDHEFPETSCLTASGDCCTLFGTSIMSAVGSCICGIPSALCLCGSMTTSGALHSIIKIPMLSSVSTLDTSHPTHFHTFSINRHFHQIRARRIFFRPANDQTFHLLHQFNQSYAFWATLSASPARFARFLSMGRMNSGLQALINTLFALPLACIDIVSEQKVGQLTCPAPSVHHVDDLRFLVTASSDSWGFTFWNTKNGFHTQERSQMERSLETSICY